MTSWCGVWHTDQPAQTKLYPNHGNPDMTQSQFKIIIYKKIVVTFTAVVTIIVLAVILTVVPPST
jgi:hypothetical protein